MQFKAIAGPAESEEPQKFALEEEGAFLRCPRISHLCGELELIERLSIRDREAENGFMVLLWII